MYNFIQRKIVQLSQILYRVYRIRYCDELFNLIYAIADLQLLCLKVKLIKYAVAVHHFLAQYVHYHSRSTKRFLVSVGPLANELKVRLL